MTVVFAFRGRRRPSQAGPLAPGTRRGASGRAFVCVNPTGSVFGDDRSGGASDEGEARLSPVPAGSSIPFGAGLRSPTSVPAVAFARGGVTPLLYRTRHRGGAGRRRELFALGYRIGPARPVPSFEGHGSADTSGGLVGPGPHTRRLSPGEGGLADAHHSDLASRRDRREQPAGRGSRPCQRTAVRISPPGRFRSPTGAGNTSPVGLAAFAADRAWPFGLVPGG